MKRYKGIQIAKLVGVGGKAGRKALVEPGPTALGPLVSATSHAEESVLAVLAKYSEDQQWVVFVESYILFKRSNSLELRARRRESLREIRKRNSKHSGLSSEKHVKKENNKSVNGLRSKSS